MHAILFFNYAYKNLTILLRSMSRMTLKHIDLFTFLTYLQNMTLQTFVFLRKFKYGIHMIQVTKHLTYIRLIHSQLLLQFPTNHSKSYLISVCLLDCPRSKNPLPICGEVRIKTILMCLETFGFDYYILVYCTYRGVMTTNDQCKLQVKNMIR